MRAMLIAGFLAGWAAAQTRGPIEVRAGSPLSRTGAPSDSGVDASCPEFDDEAGAPTLTRDPSRRRPSKKPGPEPMECARPEPDDELDSGLNLTLIEHAALASARFIRALPNFVCDQLTDRYEGTVRGAPKWKLRDRISAEVLMVEGVESYRNLRRNGKTMQEGEMWRTGTWSTGEFGTVLRNLFARDTEAQFIFRRETTLNRVPAHLYDYQVTQPKSRWRVEFEGSGIFPEFTGSVWIDPLSKRVLRVEMMARNMPPSFPMDITEMTVDYGAVLIAGQSYLMPVRSENLACQRGASRCVRNTIEFRNYRKFTSESTITTVDSAITFDEGPVSKK